MDKFDALRSALQTDAGFRTVAIGLACIAGCVMVITWDGPTVLRVAAVLAVVAVGQVPMRSAVAAVQAKLDGQPVTASPCTDINAILATIRQMESGDNYTAQAQGATASGAYQFIDATWAGFGGSGHAKNAPPAEQDARATVHVRQILAEHGGDPLVVPVVWYLGHVPPGGSVEWDQVPSGNKLTPRQYRERWSVEYSSQTMACSQLAPVADGWSVPIDAALVDPAELVGKHHDYAAVDIGLTFGTPLMAIRGGEVVKVTDNARQCYPAADCGDKCGIGVVVQDVDGVRWSYCHLSRRDVELGDVVTAGQEFGESGNSGHSSGPHLHLGVSVDGGWRCPQSLLVSLYQSGTGVDPRSLPASGCTK